MIVARRFAFAFIAEAIFALVSCQRHLDVAHPATAANSNRALPSGPSITRFGVEPSTIVAGQTAYLEWVTAGARTAELAGLGAVDWQGRRAVSPTWTTTYTLRARDGTNEVSASVTIAVLKPLPTAPLKEESSAIGYDGLMSQIHDIHFDERGEITARERDILQTDATVLKKLFETIPNFPTVVIEGHCDQVASAEYAMALGHNRALTVRNAFVDLGVPAQKIQIISFGQEQPLCADGSQDCVAKNRRVHICASR